MHRPVFIGTGNKFVIELANRENISQCPASLRGSKIKVKLNWVDAKKTVKKIIPWNNSVFTKFIIHTCMLVHRPGAIKKNL